MALHALTRRKMIELSGLGAIALTVPLTVLEGSAVAAPAGPAPARLRRSSYLGLTGREFPTDAGVTLTLLKVADLGRAKTDATLVGHEEAFTLLFSGPASPLVPAAIHTLQHPELGAVNLFIAPVEAAGADRRYEAIVDRTIRLADRYYDEEGGSVAGVSASVAAASAAAAAGSPSLPARLRAASRVRVRATARRQAGKITTTLTFPGGGIQAVSVKLTRGGHTYARGTAAVRKGRAVLHLKTSRRVTRGGYTLVITATDMKVAASTVERHVTVR
jgi:hypothetical protein